LEEVVAGGMAGRADGSLEGNIVMNRNNHPTVKPQALMKYLITLITPKGGTVLDPFVGSGSTLVAAKELGFNYIGIEKEVEYIKIINARLQ
jgi:site-specific DNA-methyltransferase (adenine-specific)